MIKIEKITAREKNEPIRHCMTRNYIVPDSAWWLRSLAIREDYRENTAVQLQSRIIFSLFFKGSSSHSNLTSKLSFSLK